MKKIVLFISVTALSSCRNTWRENKQETWREACMENAQKWAGSDTKAKTYCDCVLAKIKQKYPDVDSAMQHVDILVTDSAILQCKTDAMK